MTYGPGYGEVYPHPIDAQEWTWFAGTTNAPSANEEAELLELGRRVAQERGYQSVLFDDPADYA